MGFGLPMSISVQVTVVILFLAGYVLSTVMLTWGCVRWFRQPKLRTVTAILSLLGFILASASNRSRLVRSNFGAPDHRRPSCSICV
jgi:hypothetical protein